MTIGDWSRSLAFAASLLVVGANALADAGAAAVAAAGPTVLVVGDALPALSLRDQNDAEVRIDASTKALLFTRDMGGGGLVKEALAEGGKETLAAAGAVYVSDVSRMPGLVRRAFALPSLRKRAYPVALDENGEATRSLPSSEGKATVLSLDSGKITAITFASTSAEVTAALKR